MISDETYSQTIEDFERLLEQPPEHRGIYESDRQYVALTTQESEVAPTKQRELGDHDFRPVARLTETVRYTHPILEAAGPATHISELWSRPDGVTVHLSADDRRILVSCYADGTCISVSYADTKPRLEHERREILTKTDDLGHDVARLLDRVAERKASGVRLLHVVDVDTARLYGRVFDHYFKARLPAAEVDLLDSALELTASDRRRDTLLMVMVLVIAILLGVFFSSWLVAGIALVAGGAFLWAFHRLVERMSRGHS